MMRGELTLLMLLCSVPAWAQTAAVPFPTQRVQTQMQMQIVQDAHQPITSAKPEAIVARVMSFDRDGDGKVSKTELAERMENLVEAADASGDGALDAAEVRAVAERPEVQTLARGFQAGHYGFGDESGQSSRLHIEGVLADLKLPDAAFQEASPIVTTFLDELDTKAKADLLEELRTIMTGDQLARVESALPDAQILTPLSKGPNGPAAVLLINNGRRGIVIAVPEAQKDRGVAAIDRFNKRLRLAEETDRNALLERLQNVLTDEQRDDFRAAVARRPIAKTGETVSIQKAKQVVLNPNAMPDALQRVRTFIEQPATPAAGR